MSDNRRAQQAKEKQKLATARKKVKKSCEFLADAIGEEIDARIEYHKSVNKSR